MSNNGKIYHKLDFHENDFKCLALTPKNILLIVNNSLMQIRLYFKANFIKL